MPNQAKNLSDLSAARWRIASVLTAAMVCVYFGFIALIAFDRTLLATAVMPGLSLGVLLGVLVIVATWILTWIYVSWANRHYDARIEEIRND
jgi:uncharacterized membrane protein (DUF485 family)